MNERSWQYMYDVISALYDHNNLLCFCICYGHWRAKVIIIMEVIKKRVKMWDLLTEMPRKKPLKVLKYSQLIYYIYDRKWKMDESDSKRWNFVDGLNWGMDNDYRNISGFFFDRARKTTFFRLSWWKFFFLNWQICCFFLVEECCWRKNNSYYTLYRRIYWFWFWW